MDLMLTLWAMVAVAAAVGFAAAWPRWNAVARREPVPQWSLRRSRPALVAAALFAAIGAGIWLALESASPGGVLPQRPLLEQLVPLGAALLLAVCLSRLPWRPRWVAVELRRLALALPVVAGSVLLIDGMLFGAGIMALVGLYLGWALASAALILAIGRVLAADTAVG